MKRHFFSNGVGSRSARVRSAAVAAVVSVMMSGGLARAGIYYWDGGGNGAYTTAQDGSGVWNGTTPSWLTAASGGTSEQNWVDGNEADFSANSTGSAPYTVSLAGNVTTSQIDLNYPGAGASYTFNLSGFTLTTLSSGTADGVNVNAGSNSTFVDGTLVDAPNSQTAGHPGISMRGGTITLGPGSVVRTDYISSNSPITGYANAMYFNGGTVQAVEGNADPVLYYTGGGSTASAFTGAFIQAGGLTVDTSTIEAGDTAFTSVELPLSHDPALSTADGGLTKVGARSLYLDYTSSYTGPTTVNAGTLILNTYETETSSNYVVAAGATLEAGASNSVVGVSGTNLVTLNNGTLTTANGVTAHVTGVVLNGGTVASGTPNSTYGSWALNSNGYLLVTANDTATLSASEFYMNSGSYLGVNAGATLLVSGNFASGSVVGLYGGGVTVFTGAGSAESSLILHDGATLQLQANAANTQNGVSGAIGNLGSGGFQFTDSDGGSATLQLRSDGSVTFGGTTNIGGAYLATYNFDVNNVAAVATAGPQGNTLTIGSFATYGSTVNVTGGNGYTLAIGAVTNAYGQSLNVNAVSANVTFGSIGTSSAAGTLALNAAGGTVAVTGATDVSGATTVSGSHNVTLAGNVTGTNLVMNGTGVLTLGGSDTYTGVTQVNTGTVVFAPGFAAGLQAVSAGSALNISAGATVKVATVVNHADRTLLATGQLNLAGSSSQWTGVLDLGNNDLDVSGGSVGTVFNQIAEGYNHGNWNGAGGIVSSAAASDSNHLTALGVVSNNVSGTALYGSGTGSPGLFDGTNPGLNAVLVKYTYYGDANLDGKVDGSDYSLIDAGYTSHGTLTGWQNGDFNYDGVIDGSDYALIDNAFNNQTVNLDSAAVTAAETAPAASPTAAAVPEPASVAVALAVAGLFGHRRRRLAC